MSHYEVSVMARQTDDVPNQPKTPQRSIRVDDELWFAALQAAHDRNESLSDVVRDALAVYVARHERDPDETPNDDQT